MDKISAVQNNWLDDYYHLSIKPILEVNAVPIINTQTIPLTRLYDVDYWVQLQKNELGIVYLDYRHWLYDDETFRQYVSKVASLRFRAVVISELPFDFESFSFDKNVFDKKLLNRTEFCYKQFKKSNPQNIVLSPIVNCVSYENMDRHLNYFSNCRNMFDVYNAYMCNDLKDQTTGYALSLLGQVYKILPKPVWITKWALPSCSEATANSLKKKNAKWIPPTVETACQKLSFLYTAVESICNKQTHWFFIGLGRDVFHSNKTPHGLDWWDKAENQIKYKSEHGVWDFTDFLGIMDFYGEIKQPLLDHFIDIAQKQNV